MDPILPVNIEHTKIKIIHVVEIDSRGFPLSFAILVVFILFFFL